MRKVYCNTCKNIIIDSMWVTSFTGLDMCLKCFMEDQEESGHIKILIKEEMENENDEAGVQQTEIKS